MVLLLSEFIEPVEPQTNLTFLFRITEVTAITPRSLRNEWYPSNMASGISPINGQGSLYKWENGAVTRVPNESYYPASSLEHYGTATVFTQCPNNPQLFLGVNFDASRENVRDNQMGEWRPIYFHYTRLLRANQLTNQCFSFLDYSGDRPQLSAPGNSQWIRQLFPPRYHCTSQDDPDFQNAVNAGLTGQLPLVLATVALSCARNCLHYVLTHSIQWRRWQNHNYPHGRKFTNSFSRCVQA